MCPAPRQIFGLIFASLFALLAPVFVHAQTQGAPAPTPSPQAAPTPSEVRLRVTVSDGAGRPVSNLRQEDFRLFEDDAPQTVSYFSAEESPVSYGLVVDNSGSLRSEMDKIINTAAAIVAGQKPADEGFLVRFVGRANIELVQDFTANGSLLSRRLSELYVQGGQTALIDALYVAAEHLTSKGKPEPGRRRALVLITDGDDRGSERKEKELLELLRKSDIQVFAIGFTYTLDNQGGFVKKSSREKATKLLDTLAKETGGRVFQLKTNSDFEAVGSDVARLMRAQYVLGYTPPHQTQDGTFRKLKVTLVDAPGRDKLNVTTRANYNAPGPEPKKN